MVKSQLFVSGNFLVNPSTTTYYPIIGCIFTQQTTEAFVQSNLRPAGTLSNLFITVYQNTLAATCTLRVRKNAANGNQVISISAGATGHFEDTTNTDTNVAGDDFTYSIVSGAGGTQMIPAAISIVHNFNDANIAVTKLGYCHQTGLSNASTTRFHPIMGWDHGVTTEATEQLKVKKAGTLKNLDVRVSANARTTATTVRTRKNTANGLQSISIGSGATGAFEDTVNTDTLAVDNLICFSSVTGTGTQTLNIRIIACSFESSARIVPCVCGSQSSSVLAAASDWYTFIGGTIGYSAVVTDVDIDSNLHNSSVVSNLQVKISANSSNSTATVRFNKNNANGNMSVSFSAGLTGNFEDNTNTDTINTNDNIAYRHTTAGTGTNTVLYYSCYVDSTSVQLWQKPISEPSISVSETLAKAAVRPKPISDTSISVSEALARVPIRVRQISDTSITVSDSVTGTTSGQQYDRPITEGSVSVSEALARIPLYLKPINETAISVSEDLARIPIRVRSISESAISVSETLVRIQLIIKTISDTSVSVSETLTRLQTLIRVITDPSITVSDSIISGLSYTRPINESAITVSESIERLPLYLRPISESTITVSDSIARWISVSYTLAEPSISVSESLVGQLIALRTISESAITTSETLTRLLAATRTISEGAVTINDLVTRTQSIIKQISESTISVSEALQGSLLFTALLIESRIKWYYSVLTRKIV